MHAKLLECSHAEYHRDLCEVPSLSVSIAKVLINRSPMHAHYLHPRFGNGERFTYQAKDNGSIIHALLLGKGSEIAVMPHDEYRTNAAKADRDEAIAQGKIPIKAKDYAEIATAAERVRARLLVLGIDLQAEGFVAEQPIEWDEPGVNSPVRCRAMFDLVNVLTGVIIDVKSISEATVENCAKSTWRYDYHVQDAAYRSALSALIGQPTSFTFAFCELDAPYGVLPAKCNGAFKEIGEARWRHAVRLWEECLATNIWPGYSTETVRLEPPGWALSQFSGEES